MKTFKNPILPGFYPDPSICRVGGDYYLVNSTFTYFPGIPVFHSRDLVNWRQLCYAMDRSDQLVLDGLGHNDGIYAPTIRYHDGMFYIICTNVASIGNFIITAKDPSGPWSDPYILNDAPGIDPSLFFDDDGKVYYTGTAEVPGGGSYYGDNEIWLKELDLTSMQLTGERFGLWRGALKNALWAEGPHIYKKDGYYYLMIAEGGTGFHHSVTIARSRDIKGPYEGNPANPILTHRHLGLSYPVANVGHADLVQTQSGEWWMVALASRPYGGHYRNLGRETFLMPVIWEDGWPVVCPGTGRIEERYVMPSVGISPDSHAEKGDEGFDPACDSMFDDFDSQRLGMVWNTLRTPREEIFSLTERKGFLRLRLRPEMLSEKVNPSFIGRRQQHIDFTAAASMEFEPGTPTETAGLVLIQNNDYHFRFEYAMDPACGGQCEKRNIIRLIKREAGREEVLAAAGVDACPLYLKVSAKGQDYSFYYGKTPDTWEPLLENADGRILSTDKAGGFVGAYIAMYASSQGHESSNHADFDWFRYEGC
jgi:alpha-N-arabinofuranosidase